MAKVFTIPAADAERKKSQSKAGSGRAEGQETGVYTIPVPPDLGRQKRERTTDPRYVDGQKMLVAAMNYLVKADKEGHRSAIELLSEHVRTRFRMSDRPLS
jgi:hypothetical protein